MGSPNTKLHDPAKSGYKPQKKNNIERMIQKSKQLRTFTRCSIDARYACTPENCQKISKKYRKRLQKCLTPKA